MPIVCNESYLYNIYIVRATAYVQRGENRAGEAGGLVGFSANSLKQKVCANIFTYRLLKKMRF